MPTLRSDVVVVDIHAHVNFAAFENDYDAVIQRAYNNKVAVINVGTQYDTSQKTVLLANQYPHVFSCIGLHPIHTTQAHHDTAELGEGGKDFVSRGEVFDSERYKMLLTSKVIAVGECGLDYYRNDVESARIQKKAFRDQIDFALENKLPIMLHVRPQKDTQDAYEDVIEILTEYKNAGKNIKANVHCFTGNVETAQKFIALGCTLSFTGIVTFAKNYDDILRWVPDNMFMVETDCPYLTPAPHRGQRNEPSHVRFIIEHIAHVRGEDANMLADTILKTTEQFFNTQFSRLFL